MDLSELYYKIQKASADDLAETVEPGDAKSLMLARIKALNPILEQNDIDFMERQPGAAKGAQALEDAMEYTPYGLVGRPDIGAAVAQFIPEAWAQVVGEMSGAHIANQFGKGINAVKGFMSTKKPTAVLEGLPKALQGKPLPREYSAIDPDVESTDWLEGMELPAGSGTPESILGAARRMEDDMIKRAAAKGEHVSIGSPYERAIGDWTGDLSGMGEKARLKAVDDWIAEMRDPKVQEAKRALDQKLQVGAAQEAAREADFLRAKRAAQLDGSPKTPVIEEPDLPPTNPGPRGRVKSR